MTIETTQSLSNAWQEAVESGKIVNKFEASDDDLEGRWSKGDRVAFGLTSTSGGIDYFARNLRTAMQIGASVDKRKVDGTGFVCQFNGYRALRPGGAGQGLGRQPDVHAGSAECRFGCQDPKKALSLLRRDPLLQVRLHRFRWNAYYNAAPFEKEGHFLWVPVVVDGTTTILPHFPQELTQEILEDILLLFHRTTQTIVFFNSLHAGASVDHVHVQAVFHKDRLAIEDARTASYRGFTILDGYPAEGLVFSADSKVADICGCVNRLQSGGIPFNLMLLGSRVVLVPRNSTKEIVAEFPGGVLGTMELAGKIITVDRNAYERANQSEIETAFAKVTLPARQLIDSWSAA